MGVSYINVAMVQYVNIAADDNVVERAKQIKSNRGLSWPEFLETAVEELEE